MSGRDFIAGMREAERARAERELPRAAEDRIRARVDSGRSLRPWAWGMGLGTALAVGVAVLIGYAASRSRAPALPPVVEEFVMASPDSVVPQLRADGSIAAEHGGFTAFDRRTRLEVTARQGAVLRHEADGLRMVAGTATLDVVKRAPGEPAARVLVSAGAIEVLGTRFTIVQEPDRGTVTLHEGRIRFRQLDGREVTLSPGESLSWPLPLAESAAVEPLPQAPGPDPVAVVPAPPRRAEKKKAAAPPAFDVEAFIDDLSVLRRRGQFADAAQHLEGALQKPLAPATAERLSYELGSILTWQLKDSSRACSVWNDHIRKWPDGRYAAEIERARGALGCP